MRGESSYGVRILAFAPYYRLLGCAEGYVEEKTALALSQGGASVHVEPRDWKFVDSVSTEYDLTPLIRNASANGMSGWAWKAFRRMVGRCRVVGTMAEYRRDLEWANWARASAARALGAHRRGSFDMVLSFDGYGHLAAERFRHYIPLPWVAVWNDPFPVTKCPPPYGGGLDAPIRSYHDRLLARVATDASWHVFPSSRLCDYMLRLMPSVSKDRCSIVPHLLLDPQPGRAGRAAPESDGVFTLCHAGHLDTTRRIDALVAALVDVRRELRKDHILRFVCIGEDSVGFERLSCASGLSGAVEFFPSMPYRQSMSWLRRADVLVIIEAPQTESIFLPSKLADYVQAGTPVLALSPKVGAVADLLTQYGGGLRVDSTDPRAIASGILLMYKYWSNGELDIRLGVDRLRAALSPQCALREYRRIFTAIGVGRDWQS